MPAPPQRPSITKLDTPVTYVRGVGPRLADTLAAKGILIAEDLLYHLPFRYEDRRNPRSLDELKPGEMASVIAEVRGTALLRTRRMPIFEMTVGQGNLAMKCVWFNGTYLQGRFHAGQTVALFGKIEPSKSSRYKLSTADAIIYATAQAHRADLLTCDRHFETLPNVRFVPKLNS